MLRESNFVFLLWEWLIFSMCFSILQEDLSMQHKWMKESLDLEKISSRVFPVLILHTIVVYLISEYKLQLKNAG